jgi:hypothetical protein
MTDEELPKITETKEVWLVIQNTDNTEGRGKQFVAHVCEIEATAIRLGRGNYVQGSNCPIEKTVAVRTGRYWLGPVVIQEPSKDDDKTQEKLNAKRDAFQKAISAGLSEDDLRAMGVNP